MPSSREKPKKIKESDISLSQLPTATALALIHAAFEGLAPLLVEHGITSPQAEALLRAVCVHVVAKAQKSEGRRPNISQVSMKTGVDRHTVAAILKEPSKLDVRPGSRRDSVSRVINGWSSDPEYTDKGHPQDLDIGGPGAKGRSVWTLVQKYAPGVWPRLVLDELIRVDFVETLPNGRLRFKATHGSAPMPRSVSQETATQRLSDAVRALLRDATEPESRRVWRTAETTDIRAQDLPLVRKMLRDRLNSMFAWMTDELNSARWRHDDSGAGVRIRVGLSGFTFEEALLRGADNEHTQRAARSRTQA